jgi:chaperone required for assembly of F1-ATPase
MPDFEPKRLYKKAGIEGDRGRYRIVLDGRQARTPGRADLAVPWEPMARAIATEWDVQKEVVSPLTMPLTRLAATAIDRIGPHRDQIVDIMVQFGSTDLLCYRADAPEDLTRRQHETWQPLLDWAEQALGARMAVTIGVVPVPQPEEALVALKCVVEAFDDFRLAAASSAAAATASLILALALAAGRIDAKTAFEASQLDESYQIERWGLDSGVAERRRRIESEIAAAARFLEFCQSS